MILHPVNGPRFILPLVNNYFGSGIDPDAQTHYDRVIADGGIVPAGLQGCNQFFKRLKFFLGVSDITTVELAVYDEHYLGCRLGNGAGITSGQAIDKKYSACGASTDLVQTTAASQPLLLVHTGRNYYYGANYIASDGCTTPNGSDNDLTGDFEIISESQVYFGSNYYLTSKAVGGSNMNFVYGFESGGLVIYLSVNGSTLIRYAASVSLSSVGYSSGDTIQLKVTRSETTGEIKFYHGPSYTQLGTTISGVTGTLYNSTADLIVGNYGNIGGGYFGKIYYISYAKSIGGAPSQIFNPENYNPSINQNQFTSTTGEIWTITSNVADSDIGYYNVIVTKTISQADGIDDNLQVTGLSPIQYLSTYIASRKFATASTRSPIFLTLGSASSVDAHATWFNANFFSLYNGAVINSTENSVDTVVLTGNFDNTNSSNLVNDSDKITGSTGTFSGDSITTYSKRGAASQCVNAIISTTIVSKQVDSVPINTALFQFIREFNNDFAL